MNFTKTPAMMLHELCIQLTNKPPVFCPASIVEGTNQNQFLCLVKALDVETSAVGRSKKEAKQEAARKALSLLKQKGLSESTYSNFEINYPNDNEEVLNLINYKGKLDTLCSEHNIPPAKYIELSADGADHDKKYTFECQLTDSVKATASASTKKAAKQMVAKEMIARLKDVAPAIAKHFCDERMKLSKDDDKVTRAYEKTTKLGKSLGKPIHDYNHSLREIMKEKGVTSQDLERYFVAPHNQDKLERLLNTLGLKYKIIDVTGTLDKYFTAIVEVNVEWRLSSIGQSDTLEEATDKAIKSAFAIIKDLTTS